MNDYQPHEMYCPSCSAPSPAGGLCASCLALPEPVFDANTWIREVLAEDPDWFETVNAAPSPHDAWLMSDERVCPNCSGPSPTGGYCASCLPGLQAEAGGNHSTDDHGLELSFLGGSDDGDPFETSERLRRGNLGEKLAAEALADDGHQILSYKPDILGTNQGGVDIVTMKEGTVYLVDNKALSRDGNVSSVSALTTNFEENLAAVVADLQEARNRATLEEQRTVLDGALTAIAEGDYSRVVTNANLTQDDAVLSGLTDRLVRAGIEFINLFRR